MGPLERLYSPAHRHRRTMRTRGDIQIYDARTNSKLAVGVASSRSMHASTRSTSRRVDDRDRTKHTTATTFSPSLTSCLP